jgi:hypothetical protein
LILFTKKSKNDWVNLRRNDYEDEIIYEYKLNIEDIGNKQFREF